MPVNSGTVDELDRKILHALQINGRAAFSLIGEAVGASEQTIARRYRRLQADGVVRVVGLIDPQRVGQLDWMVRITCRPHAAATLATALAQRDDVAWVSLTGAGNEIFASLRARTQDAREELLLRRLPKTEQVLNLSAVLVMHRFTGRYDQDWKGFTTGLDPSAVAALVAARAGQSQEPGVVPASVEPIGTDDAPLLTALAADGRTSVSVLAEASGWSQARTRRRLDALIGSGHVYLDVDLSMPALGLPLLVMLWLAVEPQYLDTFGNALVEQPEITFAGAITGPSNLCAAMALTGVDALYHFINRVGEIAPGLRQLEVAPVIQRIKQAGSLVDGSRLRAPSLRAAAAPSRPTAGR